MAKKKARTDKNKYYIAMRKSHTYKRNEDGTLKRDDQGRYEFDVTSEPRHSARSGPVACYVSQKMARQYSTTEPKQVFEVDLTLLPDTEASLDDQLMFAERMTLHWAEEYHRIKAKSSEGI